MTSSSSSSAAAEQGPLDPAQAQARLEQLRGTCEALARKLNEMELEQNEHKLVCEALAPLDPGRKCFRMIGGVIVERTVREVAPDVRQKMELIGQSMTKLTEQLKAQQAAADAFAKKHKINAGVLERGGGGGGAAAAAAAEEGGGGSAGVLI